MISRRLLHLNACTIVVSSNSTIIGCYFDSIVVKNQLKELCFLDGLIGSLNFLFYLYNIYFLPFLL